MNTRRPRWLALLVTAVLALFALAACGGGGGSGGGGGGDASPGGETSPSGETGTAGGGEATGEPEKTDLTVAINPSTQFAPFFYGIQEGIFEEHGLELEVVPQTDIAAIISGIASGTYDFGFATVVHVVTANANGVPIRTVSTIEGQIQEDDEGTTTIASAESGITEIAELEGKRVATVGLSSHNTLTLRALADQAGIDPRSIELVQLPFPQMPAALEAGDVDAAVLQWPFAGQALEAGGKTLAYNNRALYANTATTFFNTSQQFIDQNPNTVAAFNAAMVESIEAANEDPEAANMSLVEGLDFSEQQAENARWNVGGKPPVNMDAFEKTVESLVKYSDDPTVQDKVQDLDLETLVWPGALEQ
ncbi:ABC transporter substrate-binding protein [Citricoccus sp. SGAir0253]|uniref:ABC transporter substrate-binding protein n=1 Tax=Citricoccus sp. SGAir0253 TaxID=2567881 RepID=UPI0010CCE21C|nr:ABC transporter substrate-binding protein [Citricoccus sp. SGAir0253]QCU77568.1 ABC transporter substrate-binding protein [Citricoccus sp. SGAir0253]